VTVAGLTRTLKTKDAIRHEVKPSWRQAFFSKIVDPNVAYILFILDFTESSSSSRIPAPSSRASSRHCILLAFLVQALPITSAGLALILFAMILFARTSRCSRTES